MSEATVRAQILATMLAIMDIGRVHDWERVLRSQADLLNALTATIEGETVVRGWTIRRETTPTDQDSHATMRRMHHYRIRGLMQVDDANASEKVFQDLVESIYQAFRDDHNLGGTCITSDPLQIEAVDYEEIENEVFHWADLLLVVHERDFIGS